MIVNAPVDRANPATKACCLSSGHRPGLRWRKCVPADLIVSRRPSAGEGLLLYHTGMQGIVVRDLEPEDARSSVVAKR